MAAECYEARLLLSMKGWPGAGPEGLACTPEMNEPLAMNGNDEWT